MALLSEFIWAEEECGSGLPESAIREAYSASPVFPRWERRLCWIAFVPLPHLRFPKDVINVMFGCSETADILGRQEERRNVLLLDMKLLEYQEILKSRNLVEVMDCEGT